MLTEEICTFIATRVHVGMWRFSATIGYDVFGCVLCRRDSFNADTLLIAMTQILGGGRSRGTLIRARLDTE